MSTSSTSRRCSRRTSIIVGGGISKQADKWVPRLTGIRARIVPAALLNDAGIVGAAMATPASAPDTSGLSGTGH